MLMTPFSADSLSADSSPSVYSLKVIMSSRCLGVFLLLQFFASIFGVPQWGQWVPDPRRNIYQRFNKACDYDDTRCIYKEQTTSSCFESCKTVGDVTSGLQGFAQCTSICLNGFHTRQLTCAASGCYLTQTKRCVNDVTCSGGSWGDWIDYVTSQTSKCNNTQMYLVIRHCIRDTKKCDNSTGGSPYQVRFQSCSDVTTSITSLPSTTTRGRKRVCVIDDCVTWAAWLTWSACGASSGKRERSRVCDAFPVSCEKQVITQSFLEDCVTSGSGGSRSDQRLILILVLTMAGIVLISIATFALVRWRRRVVKSDFRERSPTYQTPIDTLTPSGRVRMEGDNIYASIG